MDQIFKITNTIHKYNKKYPENRLNLPEIVVIGSQSTGKSSILERIIGHDILPKGSEIATRCPINLQLIHDENVNLSANFSNDTHPINNVDLIRKKLQSITDEIKIQKKGVDSQPIIIQLKGNKFPTLTLTDLPGIIKNSGNLPADSPEMITAIAEQYAECSNTIILAISAANCDLANSDSIYMANKYDPQGIRTIHVLTKMDLVEKDEERKRILQDKYLEKSKTVCVVSRYDETTRNTCYSMDESENKFLKTVFGNSAKHHGIGALINLLKGKLQASFIKIVPNIRDQIRNNLSVLRKEIGNHEIMNEENKLHEIISKFNETYNNVINGNIPWDSEHLEGGAKISVILYTVFRKQMNEIQVDEMTKEMILIKIRNATGSREVSYSIEKPYRMLLQKQINKFISPSLLTLGHVSQLLKEFVTEAIERINISRYPHLMNRMESLMTELIDQTFESTEESIKNLIDCEQNDVFCEYPNSQSVKSTKLKNQNGEQDNDMLDLILSHATKSLLPPIARICLSLIEKFNLFNKLRDIINWKDMKLNDIFDENMLKVLQQKDIDGNDVLNYLKENPVVYNQVVEYMQIDDEYHKNVNIRDVLMIEKMVVTHFDIIRNKVIYNVPKWIQKFFITDLIKKISKHLFQLHQCKEELLRLDSKTEAEVEEKKMEFKELQDLLQDFDQLNKL